MLILDILNLEITATLNNYDGSSLFKTDDENNLYYYKNREGFIISKLTKVDDSTIIKMLELNYDLW